MKCSEVMTHDPVCCISSDSASKAARLMRLKDIGSLPVVSGEAGAPGKTLVGIVTDRDLALKVVGESRNPDVTRVDEVMSQEPVTCSPDDDLNDTLSVMSRWQIRRIPVVDDQKQIVGIIAQADVALRTDNVNKTAQLVEEVSRPEMPQGK